MDDEHERQQRDLQRATTLLETMSREEMVEMLLHILSNERSDDTRKLSDWMAFQIILHDETRHARKLLAQLGKDGRNLSRLRSSLRPSATRHSPTSPGQELKLRDDDPEERSSSTASFQTCPETYSVNAFQPEYNVVGDGVLAEAQAISGTLPNAAKMQLDEKQNSDDGLAPSTSEVKDLCRSRDKRTSWVQRWCDTILRRKPQHPSESKLSNGESQQPGASMALVPSRCHPETIQNEIAPGFRLQSSGKIRITSAKIKSLKTTNELGYKNLAELFARYGKAEGPGQEAGVENLEIPAGPHLPAVSASKQASEDVDKMQCRFCKLYFTPEQNLCDLDNGRRPCSFHPGEARKGGALGLADDDPQHAWTCCHRFIPDDESPACTKKTPGCVSIYHEPMEKSPCHMCYRLFGHGDHCPSVCPPRAARSQRTASAVLTT